ncbi:hypothetical protein [Embleya sp. NPDC001921]
MSSHGFSPLSLDGFPLHLFAATYPVGILLGLLPGSLLVQPRHERAYEYMVGLELGFNCHGG